MMGSLQVEQAALFALFYEFSLERQILADHLLRRCPMRFPNSAS